MAVRMLVARIGRRRTANTTVRVIGVVHARPEVRVVGDLILVVEAEGVAELLAHHQLPARRCVVLWGAEVGAVHLGRGLRDVLAAGPYLSDAQPAILAVGTVADLHPPARRTTGLWVSTPGDDPRVKHPRLTPVRGGGAQVRIPLGRDVVAKFQRERVALARPMEAIPRMIRPRGRRKGDKRHQGSECRPG